MKIRNRIKIIFSLAGIVLVGLFASNVFAQEVRTFTIVPPSIEVSLDPGGYTEGVMKVINDSAETLNFTTTMRDYIVQDSNGTPLLLPDNTLSKKYSAASWIAVSPSYFSVDPGKQQIVNYYIQVPADARPGGHYSAVVFKPTNTFKVEGSGAAVNTDLGTLFYIGVNGDIQESAKVLRISGKKFNEYGPVELITSIINLGDLHIKPMGSLTVTNLFGRKVQTLKFPERNIFPGATRDFKTNLGGKIMVGPYKATFLASYGKNNNLPLMATFTFWVFPWKIAILIALVLVAVVLGLIYRRRQASPRENKEESIKNNENNEKINE